MDSLSLLLLGVFLPGAIAALIIRSESASGAGARSVSIGTLAGLIAIDSLPSLPPIEAPDYLPFLALAALVWGQLEARLLAAAPLRLTAAFVLLWSMTAAQRQHTWEGSEPVQWIGGLGLGIAALWTLSVAGIQRSPPRAAGLALTLLTILSAIALGASGSARYGQLAGALAAAMTGMILSGRAGPSRENLLAVVPTLALILGALLAAGVLFSELPLLVAGLLVLAPTGLLLGTMGRGRAGASLVVLIALLATGLVLGAASADPGAASGY